MQLLILETTNLIISVKILLFYILERYIHYKKFCLEEMSYYAR